MQAQVKAQFREVAAVMRKEHGEISWVDVSAEGSKETVEDAVWEALDRVLSTPRATVGALWHGPTTQ